MTPPPPRPLVVNGKTQLVVSLATFLSVAGAIWTTAQWKADLYHRLGEIERRIDEGTSSRWKAQPHQAVFCGELSRRNPTLTVPTVAEVKAIVGDGT